MLNNVILNLISAILALVVGVAYFYQFIYLFMPFLWRQRSLMSPLDCLPAKAGETVNGDAHAPFILTVDWLGWLCYYPKSYLSCDTMFAHSRFIAFRTGQSAFCKSMIAFYILIHARNKKFVTMRTLKITGLNVKHCARCYARYRH